MLSITTKRGKNAGDAGKVADYPDENRSKEKHPGAIEDYYSQSSGKTPSMWMGSAAGALGLSGQADRDDHIKTLQGLDSRNGDPLVQGAGTERRYGWDLTFSAPKSVSIVWAIGPEETRKGIEAAMMRSVEKTLAFIEERFELGRRGKGGFETEKVKLLAAAFLHGSSREQDPQVHIHLMLQNLSQRLDGSWGAIDPREIFEWKLALGALFRADLSAEMVKLGFHVEKDEDSFRIRGIPKALEGEFSRRREQIEAFLKEKGFSGGKASEVAALHTRKEKEVLDTDLLKGDWIGRAEGHGVTRDMIETLPGRERTIEAEPLDRKALLEDLTRMQSVFSEKDFWKAVAVELSHRGLDSAGVKKEIEAFSPEPELVKLRGRDGKTYFTTREMLEMEKGIVARAEAGKADRSHILEKTLVEGRVARYEFRKGFSLSDEQRVAVDRVTTDPGRIQLVRGWAGAGKTTALEAARMAWEEEKMEVIGCAPSGKAADGLQSGSGIKSQTVHSLLNEFNGTRREDGTRSEPSRILSRNSVIVLDEAGMVDSRILSSLMDATEKSGAKLVLVGDDRQLAPVQAGAPFRTLVERMGAAELTENRRQREGSDREASKDLREGRTREALQTYLDKGTLSVAETRYEGIREIIDKWSREARSDNLKDRVIGATTRAEVAELNRQAREHLKETGVLTGPGTEIRTTDRSGNFTGNLEFIVGDRIMFKNNDRKLGVKNGQVGTLEKMLTGNEIEFTVKMEDGRKVSFSPDRYSSLKHGYAMTAHELQGMTVEKSFVLVSQRFTDRELNYVLGTRHKGKMGLVLTAPMLEEEAGRAGIELKAENPLDRVKELMEKMGKSREKESSLDYAVVRDHGIRKEDPVAVREGGQRKVVRPPERGRECERRGPERGF